MGTTSRRVSALRWGVVYTGMVLVGVGVVFGWSNFVWDGGFLFSARPGTTTGDHAQLTYYFWLWWDSLTTWSHLPWQDAYQFAATGYATHQPFGWPLVLVTLPVMAVYGPIAAFNAAFYGAFLACAGAAYLWVRRLGASSSGAALAGFVFAFAPFRLAQRTHINSLLAFLLPLTLYFVEVALRGSEKRSKTAAWCCVLALVSLTASGEMHLVVYFVPTLIAYVWIRSRGLQRDRLRRLLLPATSGVAGGAIFVLLTFLFVHNPSQRAGRDFSGQIAGYAPRLSNIITRGAGEHVAYPGLIAASLAILGVIVLRKRSEARGLLWFLVAVLIGSYVLAIIPSSGEFGTELYGKIPGISQIRVPGRILILAVLAISALAGFGASRLLNGKKSAVLVLGAVLIAAIAWDGSSSTRGTRSVPADPYLLEGTERGAAVLDLPPFDSRSMMASRYMLQIIENPGARAGGYSVFTTRSANEAQQITRPLADVPVDGCRWFDVSARVPFQYVTVHQALFGPPPLWPGDAKGLVAALTGHTAFERVSATADVVVFRFNREKLGCARPPNSTPG